MDSEDPNSSYNPFSDDAPAAKRICLDNEGINKSLDSTRNSAIETTMSLKALLSLNSTNNYEKGDINETSEPNFSVSSIDRNSINLINAGEIFNEIPSTTSDCPDSECINKSFKACQSSVYETTISLRTLCSPNSTSIFEEGDVNSSQSSINILSTEKRSRNSENGSRLFNELSSANSNCPDNDVANKLINTSQSSVFETAMTLKNLFSPNSSISEEDKVNTSHSNFNMSSTDKSSKNLANDSRVFNESSSANSNCPDNYVANKSINTSQSSVFETTMTLKNLFSPNSTSISEEDNDNTSQSNFNMSSSDKNLANDSSVFNELPSTKNNCPDNVLNKSINNSQSSVFGTTMALRNLFSPNSSISEEDKVNTSQCNSNMSSTDKGSENVANDSSVFNELPSTKNNCADNDVVNKSINTLQSSVFETTMTLKNLFSPNSTSISEEDKINISQSNSNMSSTDKSSKNVANDSSVFNELPSTKNNCPDNDVVNKSINTSQSSVFETTMTLKNLFSPNSTSISEEDNVNTSQSNFNMSSIIQCDENSRNTANSSRVFNETPSAKIICPDNEGINKSLDSTQNFVFETTSPSKNIFSAKNNRDSVEIYVNDSSLLNLNNRNSVNSDTVLNETNKNDKTSVKTNISISEDVDTNTSQWCNHGTLIHVEDNTNSVYTRISLSETLAEEKTNTSSLETTLSFKTVFFPTSTTNEDKCDPNKKSLSHLEITSLCKKSNMVSSNQNSVSCDSTFSQDNGNDEVLPKRDVSNKDFDIRTECPTINQSSKSLSLKINDHTLDSMDETCAADYLLPGYNNESLINSKENDNKNNTYISIQESKENEVVDKCEFKSDESSKKFEDSLDFTCKPVMETEETILCEETLVLCQSIVKETEVLHKRKDLSNVNTTGSSFVKEIDLDMIDKSVPMDFIHVEDSLALGSSIANHFIDNNKDKSFLNLTGNIDNSPVKDVSGFALDYTCSKSDSLDPSNTFHEDLTSNKEHVESSVKISLEDDDLCKKTINIISTNKTLNNDGTNHQFVINDDLVDLFRNKCLSEDNERNDLELLSETMKSVSSNKCFTIEEVNFLKINLLKVMEMLKTDNNSFEAYKLETEAEKNELLEKIKNLEFNLNLKRNSLEDSQMSSNIPASYPLEEQIPIGQGYIINEELARIQKEYNDLLNLVLVKDCEFQESNKIACILNDLNITVDDIMTPISKAGQYVFNNYKVMNIMLSFSEEIKALKTELVKKSNESAEEIKLKDEEISLLTSDKLKLKDELENLLNEHEKLKQSSHILQESNNALQSKLTSCEKELSKLQLDIDDMAARYNTVNSNFDLYKIEFIYKECDVAPLKEERNTLQRELTTCIEKLEEVTRNFMKLQSDYESCCNSLNDNEKKVCEERLKIVEIEKSYEMLKLKHEESLNIIKNNLIGIENLTKKLSNNETNCDNLQKHIIEKQEKINNLQEFFDISNCEMTSLNNIIDLLNDQFELLQSGIDSIKSDYESKKKSLSEVDEEYNKLKGSYCEITDEMKLKYEEVSLLTSDKLKLKDELENLVNNNRGLEQKLSEIQENHDSWQSKYISCERELSKLQVDIDDLNARYNTIISDFDLYKNNYIYQECDFLSLKEEINTLASELAVTKGASAVVIKDSMKLQTEYEECRISHNNAEKQLCGERQKVVELEKSYEMLKLKYEESIDIINNRKENENLSKQIADYETNNGKLNTAMTNLQLKVDELEQILSIKTKENESLICNNNEAEENIVKLKDQISVMKKQIDEFTLTSEGLQEELTEKKEKINALEESNSILCNEINSLKAIIDESNNKLNLLQTEIDNVKCEYESKQKSLFEVEEEYNKIKGSYSEIAEEMKLRNEEISLLTSNKLKLKDEVEALGQKVVELEKSYEMLKIKYEESVDMIDNNKIGNENLIKKIADYETNNESLNTAINNLQLKVDELEESLSIKTKENETLICSHKEAKENVDKLNDQMSVMKKQVDEFTLTIEKLLKELTEKKDSINVLEESNSILCNEINSLKAIIEWSNNKLDLLQTEIDSFKCQYESKQKSLFEVQEEYNKLIGSHSELTEEMKLKNEEISLLASDKLKLKDEVETLGQKVIELEKSYEMIKIKYEGSVDIINNNKIENENLIKQIADYETNNESLNTAMNNLQLKVDELEQSLSIKTKENECLIGSNKEAEENIGKLKDQISVMKKQIDEFTLTSEKLQGELTEKGGKIYALEESNSTLCNEINSLKSVIGESNNKLEFLQTEIDNLKCQYESKQKSLSVVEEENNNLKGSHSELTEEMKLKNEEISLLASDKLKLKDELEKLVNINRELEEKLSEIQENHDSLQAKYISRDQDLSKLQVDIDDLNARYNTVISDFDLYKNNYIYQECDFLSLKEEINTLASELTATKEASEVVIKDSIKLQTEYEECRISHNNAEKQLCGERQKVVELEKSYEMLKLKYEESVDIIANNKIENENLSKQITDYETNIGKLNTAMTNLQLKVDELEQILSIKTKENQSLICSSNEAEENISKLKDQISVMKKQIDEFTLTSEGLQEELSEKKGKINALEESNSIICNEINSLKAIIDESNNKLYLLQTEIDNLKCEYESKQKSLFDIEEEYNKIKRSYSEIAEEMKLKNEEISILNSDKTKFKDELENLININVTLEQKQIKLQESHTGLENEISTLNNELCHAKLKVDVLKNLEEQMETMIKKYKYLSHKCNLEHQPHSGDSFHFISMFLDCVATMTEELMELKEKHSEDSTKLADAQNEIIKLSEAITNMTEKLDISNKETVEFQEKFFTVTQQYNNLLESSKEANLRCNSLLEKLKESEVKNNLCKGEIEDLKMEIEKKDSIILGFNNINDLYESAIKENKVLSLQVAEKIKEQQSMSNDLKLIEDKCIDLKNMTEQLEIKCLEYCNLYSREKEQNEVLCKEKEEIRKELIKYEKEYQHSLDLLSKSQESLCNLDKQYNEHAAKFNVVLKEKENYENLTLTLQKKNDELGNLMEEVNLRNKENEGELVELRKAFEAMRIKYESIIVELESSKRDNDILKHKYNVQSNELNSISSSISSLVPGSNSVPDVIRLIEEKLRQFRKMEEDLEEEKTKSENLDEECNLLNEDLKYKDRVIGDMYKDHSTKMNELKELLKKEENLRQESVLENSTLKDKIKLLDSEILKLKTTEPTMCSSCGESKKIVQQLKRDLVDQSSKVTSLQLQIENNESSYKSKIHEYRKKVSSLQEELSSAVVQLKENKHLRDVSSSDEFTQTETFPVQICAQSGIVQSAKIKEQEDKIQKIEKENFVLKRMCQNRLQTIQDLKTKLESASKQQKPQRNALEEVQNQQT